MTTVVSWISNEREFPTLWTASDTQLSRCQQGLNTSMFDCASKILSIRIQCVRQEESGHYFDDVYYSTTIGMAYAGSSLIALNLYTFISYTLSSMGGTDNALPSMKDISDHIYKAFEKLLANYDQNNEKSTPVEVSIFGYCPQERRLRLFHIRHNGVGKNFSYEEFKFSDTNPIHVMGSETKEISQKIISRLEERYFSPCTRSEYWRIPLNIVNDTIKKQHYPEIGGMSQLGICYPSGFKLSSLYAEKPYYEHDKLKFVSQVMYQGIDLYADRSLMKIGDCSVEPDIIEIK